MTFNSAAFVGFLIPIIILYYVLPARLRALWVFLASAAFYAFYNWKVLPFLIIYGLAVHFLALFLESRVRDSSRGKAAEWLDPTQSDQSQTGKRQKSVNGREVHPDTGLHNTLRLAIAIVLLLVPLAVCKYTGFALSIFGREMTKSIVLPLGISYFTFKSVSYLVDVSRGKCRVERDPVKTLAFVTFFPEILTGPIDRADNLLVQLNKKRPRFAIETVQRASLLFLAGCFLKMVIADRLGIYVDAVYGALEQTAGLPVVIAAIAYSLQIYFDFAGCTLMALGVGKLMGFELPENFRRPYLAVSVADFWRRWHISLTSWLRDYVYIPLGGNRKGTVRKYLNILIVFAVSGIWHGAGWTFIVWGLLNGIYQVAEGVLGIGSKARRGVRTGAGRSESSGSKGAAARQYSPVYLALRRLAVFVLITITWVFFRAPSMGGAWQIFSHMGLAADRAVMTEMLEGAGFLAADQWLLVIVLVIVFVAEIIAERGGDWLEWAVARPFVVKCLIFYVLIFGVLVFGIYGTAYDAASFIYLQF